MDQLIAFRAPNEVAAALRAVAKERGCSVSRLIRDAINRDMRASVPVPPARVG